MNIVSNKIEICVYIILGNTILSQMDSSGFCICLDLSFILSQNSSSDVLIDNFYND